MVPDGGCVDGADDGAAIGDEAAVGVMFAASVPEGGACVGGGIAPAPELANGCVGSPLNIADGSPPDISKRRIASGEIAGFGGAIYSKLQKPSQQYPCDRLSMT